MPAHRQGSNGTKKYGRNEIKCARYRARHTREKHKVTKLKSYMKKTPK